MRNVDCAPQAGENSSNPAPPPLTKRRLRGIPGVPELLTLNEAARILRVHRNTLNNERSAGRLRVTRIGRRVLVSSQQLAEYIDQQQTASEEPCQTTASLNTAATGLLSAGMPITSTSTGADRGRDKCDAVARAQAMLYKPNSG